MTPTERLEAAAAKLYQRAARQVYADKAAEDRAVAKILGAIAAHVPDASCDDAEHRIFQAALTLAGSVGVSDD